ncbi:LacI family DNA-binding transcriptional regulator [Lacisediminimonas sp.]|uniref:LacI family DNA-binding transcriptional regulator n=1 Tax=Lacisediminimonas sp. TaxID=3060582 RepID=UPI002726B96F|nr:LacI family DNA-binding transcriptional regulator [Lacisediminimonas sp.]MDO8300853.1 LacI family DNA-binding transcriptional regulator [Lacisediminimonas sp.]
MAESKSKRVRAGSSGHRIEEVAKLAGVAPITVSRVLNKPDTVSEKTRAAVWTAIEKIGYIPNRLAGGLASNTSRTVGMVLPYIDNPAFAERVQGVTDVISAEGYTLLLGLSGYSPQAELEHVISFLGQRVAGLILTGTVHAERTYKLLENAGIPVVEVPLISGRLIDMAVGYSTVDASYAMVEHLLRCGYRKIGLISTPIENDQIVRDRRAGYDRALADFGLALDETMKIEAKGGVVNGEKAFVELLSRHPDIDAVFCTTDIHAIGCMLEAKRRGIDVPADIGIAGFDDIELAQEFLPPLTTVRLRRYEIGRNAANMLMDRFRGNQPAQRTIDLGFEVIVRGSTKKLRK